MTVNQVVQAFHKLGQGPAGQAPAPASNPQAPETATAAGQPSSADLLNQIHGMTAAEKIADYERRLASGELGADVQNPDAPRAIGGFVAPQRAPAVRPWGEIEPSADIYYEGDERLPSSMAVEDVFDLQRAMAVAGLLKGDFRKGIWDKKSRKAFKDLLAYANQQRLQWAKALNVYASSQSSEGPDVEGFLPARYQAMDPEAVKQEIQTFSESRLDRMLSEAELNEMYAVYTKADRQGSQAQQAAQEDTFNREMGIEVEGDLPDQVGPLAVMKSVFDKKYSGAISATESARERDAGAAGLRTVGSTVSEMI